MHFDNKGGNDVGWSDISFMLINKDCSQVPHVDSESIEYKSFEGES